MRIIMFLLAAAVPGGQAVFGQTDAGSRERALGGACVALGGDVWAASVNPGALSRLERGELSLYYSPGPYGLSPLSTRAAAAGVPTRLGTISLSAQKFGYELYQEITAALSCAWLISHAGLGFTLNYHTARIQGYGSAGTIAIDGGILVEPVRGVSAGAAVKNLNAAKIGVSREPLPQVHEIGLSYRASGNLILALDLHKESGYAAAPRCGVEYRPAKGMVLRGGISDVSSGYSAGIGVRWESFVFDYSITAHQELGWTHDVTLSVRLGGGHE
jgi:hypothetical protein